MEHGKINGYARVSTKEQNEARQILALSEAGIPCERIYIDKLSGKDFNRPQYKRLIRKLRRGDKLVVKSIDRLGRNYREIIEQWRFITQTKGADIAVLDMPLLDTGVGKDLTGTLVSDIVLQLLSYVAQTEREFIHQRQAEGIAAAKARGVRFGARPKEKPAQYDDCVALWRSGRMSSRDAAHVLHISHTTFLRWARRDGASPNGKFVKSHENL